MSRAQLQPPEIDNRATWPIETSPPWDNMKPDGPMTLGRREWSNSTYWVTQHRIEREWMFNEMLGIHRIDQRAVLDWRDIQWIKNDICGPDSEAVMLFPHERRLLDPSNYYMVYVSTRYQLPFGKTGVRDVREPEQSEVCQRGNATWRKP